MGLIICWNCFRGYILIILKKCYSCARYIYAILARLSNNAHGAKNARTSLLFDPNVSL